MKLLSVQPAHPPLHEPTRGACHGTSMNMNTNDTMPIVALARAGNIQVIMKALFATSSHLDEASTGVGCMHCAYILVRF